MTTYTKTETAQDPWPMLRQFVGKTIQFEAHRKDGSSDAAFGVLHGVSRGTVAGLNTITVVHIGQSTVRLQHPEDGWLFYPFDAERPDGWDEVTGPIDGVAARYRSGAIVGYFEADVFRRIAPDAWVVRFGDGHEAAVYEHELRLRPRDVEKVRAMEVGVNYE